MNLKFKTKLIFSFIFLNFILLSSSYLLFRIFNVSLLFSFLISFLILIPITYLISNRLTYPLFRMIHTAMQLTQHSLGRTIDVYSQDEFIKLSKTIEGMGMELKKKIDEISKEKETLQTILKGMMEGIMMVDERGRILMVNDALRNLLSLHSDVADKMPLEVIRNMELEGAIRKVIQERRSMVLELNLPSSDGKIFEVNVIPIHGSSESIPKDGVVDRGIVAVFHDITRLKELERIRQDFVANVSHELRTPLTTIKGYAETLLEGALKEEVAEQFVQVIKRHTDRLTKIVEDLLMLSKIESKEFRLNLEPLSLLELIDEVLDLVKEPALKKNLSITKNEISPSLCVKADRDYIEQVLVNLLDNAIKYTPEGGTVKISAIEKDQKEIEIAIQDNGIGILQKDLPRIFERFYRVDKGRSQELGGTGLGLSIVKHIVQAHQGRIWVESRLGEGSTFHFTLPLKPQNRAQ